MSRKIRIAGIIDDSIVDGVGLRLTVFTQGCLRRCPGCHNPQTHDLNGGTIMYVDEILDLVKNNPLLDGITLSGGEPFLQASACTDLAKGVRDMGLNVWCYTGHTFEDLISSEDSFRVFLENIDVLVDGPFEQNKKALNSRFRGSVNQRIINVPASLREGKTILIEN